jgi:hypothetical protein
MREMQSSSGSRDDRQKREQQREEKELAKIAQLYPFTINLRIAQDYSMLLFLRYLLGILGCMWSLRFP